MSSSTLAMASSQPSSSPWKCLHPLPCSTCVSVRNAASKHAGGGEQCSYTASSDLHLAEVMLYEQNWKVDSTLSTRLAIAPLQLSASPENFLQPLPYSTRVSTMPSVATHPAEGESDGGDAGGSGNGGDTGDG